jgi:MoaA/NifB/PqqE/SkfB family radical SAM enzyme
MKSFPDIVTLRLTSRCNNNCRYCYAQPADSGLDMGFDELKKLFALFQKRGVKAVVLCGGEPLLRRDFDRIILELKKYKLKIYLDTNGDFFFAHKKLILENVEHLGLPIDFPQKSYRNPDNLANILKILDYLGEHKKRPKIRIGTVVTKDNVAHLQEIGELIKDFPVDLWKLYEFIPQYGNARKNRANLEVDETSFDKATAAVKNRFSKYFRVVVSKRKNRTNAYFMINSAGFVFMPVDQEDFCGYINIGDVFEKDIVERWEKQVLKSKYLENVRLTFNHRSRPKT